MFNLTLLQMLEVLMGSASMTVFLSLVILLLLSNRRNGDHCAIGCSLLIAMPLGIVGFWLVIDAFTKSL